MHSMGRAGKWGVGESVAAAAASAVLGQVVLFELTGRH